MLILGSSSETRAKILKGRGIKFIQKSCNFDEESILETDPKKFVLEATLGKYMSCLENLNPENSLLVADTVVSSNGKILRKAIDLDDARRILNLQSGSKVSIITAMIFKNGDLEFRDLSSTDYIFDKFDEVDLENFLNSGEWQGKAGACMVEGFCKKYIKEVRGFESCAMGLTFEKLELFLKK
jgi:septum formation protein